MVSLASFLLVPYHQRPQQRQLPPPVVYRSPLELHLQEHKDLESLCLVAAAVMHQQLQRYDGTVCLYLCYLHGYLSMILLVKRAFIILGISERMIICC